MPGYYDERHAKLALTAANQAAIAIENARLYEQAREYATLQERSRLARELHDSVTQALFSMTMHTRAAQIAMSQDGIDPNGKTAANLRQLGELTQGALAEMRALIFELRPGALQEEGLVAALRKHVAALSAREGLTVSTDMPEEQIALERAVEEHLYRLAQEALHNIVKHAGAAHAWLRLEVQQEELILEIGDDGIGFEPAAVPAGYLGLHTMADRAQQIDGAVEIRSQPGQGTMVRVVAPTRAGTASHTA